LKRKVGKFFLLPLRNSPQ